MLYARATLDALARQHERIEAHYFAPNSDGNDAPRSVLAGRQVESAVLSAISETPGARAFVCGNPAFVRSLRRNLYLAGLSLENIHSDAFVSSPQPTATQDW
jgi:ferredoxin-NADP reductase